MKSFYTKLLSIILISCGGIIAYSNTFHCSFHFDDISFITENFVIKSISNLQNIWNFLPCRFIFYLSLALNYHFHQFDVFGYHMVNLVIHLGSAILVWWLTLLTFSTPAMKENKITQHASLIALFAGLIFVSHPLQTQAVTYIVQRAASMATLFYVASLCFYVQSRLLQDNKSTLGLARFCYIFSLIAAILAMFTKENAITLPLIILLYEFSFLRTKKSLNWKCLIPFLFTLFIIPVTMLFTHHGAVNSQEIRGVIKGAGDISSMHYLLTQFRVMVTYIRLSFLPLNQNLDYDYSISKSIFELPALISFLFLIFILFSAKRLFSKYRLVSFSILWFFLTLLPESSFFPMEDVIFEHRLYLPMVGYSIFLVSSMYYLLGKNTIKTMVIALTMIITCNSVLTYQRNKVWKDDLTLWEDTARKSPHKARPYVFLGFFYDKQGNFSQAMSDYSKAIEVDPNSWMAYNDRGNFYVKQGKTTQAIFDYNKAIEINPNYADCYFNRGNLYDTQGKYTQALSDYNKVIEISPGFDYAYFNRGNLYDKQGKTAQAISDYNKVIKINPDFEGAYYYRAAIYVSQGNLTQAISDYTKIIHDLPNYWIAYNKRGDIYFSQGNFIRAMSDYNKAIGINPNYEGAYYYRAAIYFSQGNLTQAMFDFNKAIEINPKLTVAYNNRAIVYYKLKEYDKAWRDVHKAEELGSVVNPEFIKVLKQRSGRDK